MKTHYKLLIALVFIIATSRAQWTLKLSSNVYLRTWKLDTKANKEEKEIDGATITLFQNGKQIGQTTSGNGGEFTIMIPQNGEFYLTVAYPGCNTKRMGINTQNVPENITKDNFKPTFKITGGFIMVKPYPGINYSELSQDLISVEYLPNKKAFDDTEEGTEKGLGIVSKIYSAEDDLFNRFCSTNKAGDVALAKPDCPLAKSLYEKAIAMIPGEQYPVDQLAKVGLCLKDKELAEKKAAEEAAAKAAAELAAKEKEKENKDAANKKAIDEALAKAAEKNAAAIKEEEAKLAKAQNEKTAKEQAAKDKEAAANKKAEKQKADKEKTLEEKLAADNLARQKIRDEQKEQDKKGGLKIKKKTPEEIEAEAELAKKREGMAKSQAEDREAMQADAEKAEAKRKEKDKAAKEKAEKQKEGMAKSKAEDDAAMKEADDKRAKAAADREAKENEKKKFAYETKTKDGEGEMGKGDSDHKMPQVIGAAEKYKEKVKDGDGYFKMKRYKEAKSSYEEALKYKPNDVYTTSKLSEIEKLSVPK